MHISKSAVLTGALAIAVALISPSALTSATTADRGGQSLQPKTARPASSVVAKTLTSSLNAGTLVKISDHGNIVSYLSPNSNNNGHYEHIGVGNIGEGYILCYNGPSGTVNNFDVGESESGWGPATVVNSPFKVTRTTVDGRVTLTQTFKLIGETRAVQITMVLKNNTSSSVSGVQFRRQVDFDVDTGGADGWASFQNFHANTTLTSAFAFNRAADAPAGKEAHAMTLSHVGPSAVGQHLAFITSAILETSCTGAPYETGTSTSVAHGDFGDTLLYKVGTLAANASKTIVLQYARF